MPVVHVSLLRGYSREARQRLCQCLTNAVRSVIAAPAEAITVCLHELEDGDYARGGSARRPGAETVDPEALVKRFLTAMEARNLDDARDCLATDFVMTFPGGGPMTALEDLLEWARTRYRFVTKHFEGFDTAFKEDHAVVTCFGTLSGAWPDGNTFEGIRFIDRFEIRDGRLSRQQVWNDLALAR